MESRMLLSVSESLLPLKDLHAVILLRQSHRIVTVQTAPAVVPASQQTSAGTVPVLSPMQSAGTVVTGSPAATATVVKIVTQQTPSMSLRYSSGGTISNVPVLESTPVSSAAGPAQNSASQGSGVGDNESQESELTPQGMQRLPAMPWADEAEVSGTLQPAQSWMTFKIPVDSGTQYLKVTVSQLGPAGTSPIPALDQLYLVGPSGKVLTMLQGVAAYAQAPRQGVMIFLSAVPDNSMLLVRIIETTAQFVAPGTVQASASGLNVPFMMDVQRSDLAATGLPMNDAFQTVSTVGLASPLLIAYGNLAATTSAPTVSFSLDAPETDSVASVPTGMEPSAVAFPIAVGAPRLTTQVEGTAPGVSVGPLITRGSAPFRPPVGTVEGELTPSIDRNERAFDLTVIGSGAVLDAGILLGWTMNRSDGHGEDGQVDQATGTSAPVLALRGPGGLPVMVCSMRRASRRMTRSPCWRPSRYQEACQPPASRLQCCPQFQFSRPRIVSAASMNWPAQGFLKSTCSLMMAVGLTSGPLYPDLMMLCRTFLPRRTPLANSAGRSYARCKEPLRTLRRWFGLR